MKKGKIVVIAFILWVFGHFYVYAQSVSSKGLFSGWVTVTDETDIGFRYIPELEVSRPLGNGKSIDADIAINSYALIPLKSPKDAEDNSDLKLYRLWVRYSESQFEARLGLQKINFGPAKIMRTLMWFDQLDVRDPLQLTDGVYGLLTRYYFLNNANVWLWGLYGNDAFKGLEFVETEVNNLELGGRYQFPVPRGEFAFTYHQRWVDQADWNKEMTTIMSDGLEDRYAIDGNWDVGIGLWFEASTGAIKIDQDNKLRQNNLTIGTDYTFEPGIHMLYEHFIQSIDSKAEDIDETNNFSALSMDYNFSIINSVNAIGYYDWDRGKVYSYLNWQRTYDNWKINVIGFSNRKDSDNVFSGKGVQFMVTYNY